MKKNVILAFMVAGAMILTSCTRKIDEKTMADINQFGTDWAAVGEKATAWSNDLTATVQQAKDFAAKQQTMMTSMANSKDEAMKTKCADVTKAANDNVTQAETMMNDW